MIAKRLVLLVLVVALAGCGSKNYDDPLKVTSQFNPDAAYGKYKTWNFSQNFKPPEEGALSDASFRLELATMIQDALKERGLVRVFENPDLEMGVYVATESISEDELEKWYLSGDWDMPKYHGRQKDFWQKGDLILMAFESKTGQMIWRATAEAIVDQTVTVDQRREVVRRAVEKMLAELPNESQQQTGGTN
jgi:hypothetical protein